MKKMLVLALVLAVTGLSNAALLLEWDAVAKTVTLKSDADIPGSVGGINNGIGIVGNGTYNVTTAVIDEVLTITSGLTFATRPELVDGTTPIAPTTEFVDAATAATIEGFPYNEYINVAWGKALTVSPAGNWFTIAVNGTLGTEQNHVFKLQMTGFDEQGNLVNMGTPLYMVPEPMTMGLLALGGLFLRKRK